MSRTQRLTVVLALNLALVAGLVAVGITAHSLAVLAEGTDYLLDAAGAGVALLAIRLSARPASRGRPAGYPNASRIAALINAGWLLLLELLVAAAAADRLTMGTSAVDGLPVLVISGIAALVMAAGAVILRGDAGYRAKQPGERDPSVTAVLLDTVADAAAGPGGGAPHRRRRRLPRRRADPAGSHRSGLRLPGGAAGAGTSGRRWRPAAASR